MEQSHIDPARRQGVHRPPLPPTLVTELEPLLSSGNWVPRSIVEEIGKRYHVQFSSLGEGLRLAESDLGAFVCTPAPETPLEAPDEALAASGEILGTRTIIHKAVSEWRESHGWPSKRPGPKGPRHDKPKPVKAAKKKKAVQDTVQYELAM